MLNGAPAGVGWDWKTGPQFNDRAHLLRPGHNDLTIWCEHRPATGDAPGLLACLEIRFTDGRMVRVPTDASWKALKTKISAWDTHGFDDSAWPAAQVIGQLGEQPWGPITAPDASLFGPQTAGIPGATRVTYIPYAEPVVARGLAAGSAHRASHFDPVTGKTKSLGKIRAGADGTWSCPPPKGIDHDWVLVLEATG